MYYYTLSRELNNFSRGCKNGNMENTRNAYNDYMQAINYDFHDEAYWNLRTKCIEGYNECTDMEVKKYLVSKFGTFLEN